MDQLQWNFSCTKKDFIGYLGQELTSYEYKLQLSTSDQCMVFSSATGPYRIDELVAKPEAFVFYAGQIFRSNCSSLLVKDMTVDDYVIKLLDVWLEASKTTLEQGYGGIKEVSFQDCRMVQSAELLSKKYPGVIFHNPVTTTTATTKDKMGYEVKFFNTRGEEIPNEPELPNARTPLLNFFRWCMTRAMNESDDRNRAASFASDLNKHPEVPEFQRNISMCMFGMKGDELVDFIKGFSVPGVDRVEFVEIKK